VFDRVPGDAAGSYQALRYVTHLSLGTRQPLERIEITGLKPEVTLAIWKITLFDSHDRRSLPVTNQRGATELDPSRWLVEKEFDGVVVLRNKRPLPRVWLVGEAVAVDEESALRRIQGVTEESFDPLRTALLEVPQTQLPALPGGSNWIEGNAALTSYQSSMIRIETNASTASVLILSELFYPGWEATVDGRPTPILATDFLLRGVVLPAGQHRVEMRYTAPDARKGLLISALTVCVLVGLGFYSRRRSRSRQTVT
jgi:hypothetical protein